MIKIEENITSIEFSKDGKGTIGVIAHKNDLILQGLIGDVEVGGQLKQEDIQELPKAVLSFHSEESINVVIKALEAIKENIKLKNYSYALAC